MLSWLLTLALLPGSSAAATQTKDTKKAPDKPGTSVEDLLKEAEGKAAAGDLAAAVEVLQKASRLPTATGEVWLGLGRVLEAKYELDAAADAYKEAASKLAGVGKGEALGRLSWVQRVRVIGDPSAVAESAAAADPDGVWPVLALARARAAQGKTDEAVALARRVLEKGGAPAQVALGFAQEARGEFAAAEAAFRAALATGGGRVEASVGLARVLRRTGRAAEAEPILQQALSAAPSAVEAYKESARVKMALNRAEEANADAVTAAALAEGDAEAQRLVGQATVAKALVYLSTNQVDRALEELTAFRDKNPSLPEARVGLAKAFFAKRQAEPAIVELKKAIELAPDTAEAHFQLAFIRHVLKRDAAGALPSYEKAVALDPGNAEYRTNLGAALSDLKQYDRAVAELGKVTRTPGYGRPDAWIYLGAAHLQAMRYKEAIPPLEKAVALAPQNAQTEAYLGWCYFGLKDSENFKKHAGRARALGHKEPLLLQYLSRIEAGEAIK